MLSHKQGKFNTDNRFAHENILLINIADILQPHYADVFAFVDFQDGHIFFVPTVSLQMYVNEHVDRTIFYLIIFIQ